MTLMNGMAAGDRALLWSDTAFCDLAARSAVAYGTKAFQALLFPAAAIMTTVGGNPYQIPEWVGEEASFRLGDFLEHCENAARRFVGGNPDHLVRLLVAGWCHEIEEARLFLIASDGPALGHDAFQAVELSNFISGGNDSVPYHAALRDGFTRERMLEIIDIQHATPFTTDVAGTWAPGVAIGGQVREVEVTRHGVTDRIVRDWPVRVAEDDGGNDRLAEAA